jgi:hypothetical protein
MTMIQFILFCSMSIKTRQLKFHLHPAFAVWSACDSETYYRVGTIKRKSAHSELHHYTIKSIYGHYDLVEVNDQELSFLLTKNEHLIAHSYKSLHITVDVNIENEKYRQFILALFLLVLVP